MTLEPNDDVQRRAADDLEEIETVGRRARRDVEIVIDETVGDDEVVVAIDLDAVRRAGRRRGDRRPRRRVLAPVEPSPYDRPGRWYVVHSYAGYENKVKSNLANRVRSYHTEDQIFEVVIPMEDVIEFKGGQRRVVQKKMYPGYVLVRIDLDDNTWGIVRNTPGSPASSARAAPSRPRCRARKSRTSSASRRPRASAREKKVKPKIDFDEGEQVRVVTGPFADFNGSISEIDVDRSKLKVLVNIFGRETPVELELRSASAASQGSLSERPAPSERPRSRER